MEEETKIEIPKVVYTGEDKKLKERITKFKVGTLRIVLFTLVGIVAGFFSHTYVYNSFFPTKLILAIPYKIDEVIYTFLLGTDAKSVTEFTTDFFPHSMIAAFLAETVTTVLISGAIYGSLAYFTGDKRVFTLQRYLKFAGVWCGVILLSIAAAYGVNTKAVADNESFRGTPEFFLYSSQGNGSIVSEEENVLLRQYFYSELAPAEIEREQETELPMELTYKDFRQSFCTVNYEKQYVITENGKTYHISEEFAAQAKAYIEADSTR